MNHQVQSQINSMWKNQIEKKWVIKKKSNDKKKGWTFILVSNLVSRASIILNQ
jgi:hypothetical protein